MIALKNDKNGSIVRLRSHGAQLNQDDNDYEDISFDLLEAAQSGDYQCFMKYFKAGFIRFDEVRNIEGKSLAHLVSLGRFNYFRLPSTTN